MFRLAMATQRDWPALCPDDAPLVPLLRDRGIEATPVCWDDPDTDWQKYDAVLIRSVWDYHIRFDEFLGWFNLLDRLRIPCWNPTSLCRWNARKTYLRDMAGKGVRTVPTHWIGQQERIDLRHLMGEKYWEEVVIKPVISASGDRTHRVSSSEIAAGQKVADDLSLLGETMIQPFVKDVLGPGEWSLIYLGGRYSHAVRKRAAQGEFRVQEEHGGETIALTPPPVLIRSADNIARQIPFDWLYARIDGFEEADTGEFILAELEALEPLLFLSYADHAHECFADAIAEMMRESASNSQI